ncbi:MAG: ABC transporter permease [Chloroflexi bacterium]|nr:ABC transporter permease [Chloroflexota bacterium]
MTRYLFNRLLQSVVVLFVFISLVFFLVQAQPGDYANVYTLDPRLTPEQKAELRKSFGLEQPLYTQYALYVRNFLEGDLGTSFKHREPVIDVLLQRLPRTVMLFATAAVISFYLGFALGKIIAWRRGRFVEYASTISGVFLFTVFTPWLALMALWLFGLQLDWLPLGQFVNPQLWQNAPFDTNYVFVRLLLTLFIGVGVLLTALYFLGRRGMRGREFWFLGLSVAVAAGAWIWWAASGLGGYGFDILKHMVLPVMVLTAISFAGTMLLTRNSMLEVLREDFVLAARAKGLPDKVVRDRHVARNAILPVVTSLIFSLATAVDGGVITESIFSWPGLGLTLLSSAIEADLPLAVGAFVFTGIFSLVAHVIADVLYVFLDPRIRYA